MLENSSLYGRFMVISVAMIMLVTTHAFERKTTIHSEERLRKQGIPLTGEGFSKYLESGAVLIDGMTAVSRLGSDDSTVRRDAERTLLKMDEPPLKALAKAAESEDPEIRAKAKEILKAVAARGEKKTVVAPSLIVESITEVIVRRKIKGCTPALMKRLTGIDDPHLIENIVLASKASVVKQDEGMLLKMLDSDLPRIRYAALSSLLALASQKVVERLGTLADDPDSLIRYHAALKLLNDGDRNALLLLIGLLSDSNPVVRNRSVNCLRNATGKSFNFIPWEHPRHTQPQASAWKAWYEKSGTELLLPTSPKPKGKRHLFYFCFNHDYAYELDPAGKQVWKVKIPKISFQVMGLPLGHRLVLADDWDNLENPILTEYDQNGKVFWKLERKDRQRWSGMGQFTHMQPLEDGNIMFGTDKIAEYDRSGKLLRTVAGPKTRYPNYFTYSTKLPNGRYLGAMFLGDSNREGMVVELNPDGKLMWAMTGLGEPTGVLRKPNGNTVIFQFAAKRLSEFTPEGKEVWGVPISCQNGYASLQNLDDGKIFVSAGYHVMVLDGKGKMLSKKRYSSMCRAHLF